MEFKQVIIVRKDLKMGVGKTAAQVAHASLAALRKADRRVVDEWEAGGSKKIILKVENLQKLEEIIGELRSSKIPNAVIRDAGLTQVDSGTVTCVGIGPLDESRLDKVTSGLKLL